MLLTIDNNDGAGARDYTSAIDATHVPHVIRRLNRPTEMSVGLVATMADFVVPAANARIVLARDNGESLFTGNVVSAPEYEYLGWGERGPTYRYSIQALSDEWPLSAKLLPERSEFVTRSAGEMVATLANDAAPGAMGSRGCEGVSVVPSYWPDPRLRFHEHAAELAVRSRAAYSAKDGQLSFEPIGATTHLLDETSPEFCPEGLKLECTGDPLNDVTVAGAVGPGAYVKDYFSGNGYTLSFPLSEMAYLRSGTVLLDEEYRGAILRPQYWSVSDPRAVIALSGGKLQISGGTGQLGTTLVRFAEKLELAGALALDHGQFDISGGADAIVGGIYNGNFEMAACVAGFRLTPSSGAATQIAAVVNGIPAGQAITTVAGRKYVLATRIYAGESYRLAQRFETATGGIGGDAIPAAARFILEVHEIDPNNPASQVAPAIVLYEGVLPDVPACCDYAVVNVASMNASVSYTRLARAANVEVRTCVAGGSWRNRLVGPLTDGSECRVDGTSLYFFAASAPESAERIHVSYRAAQRTVSRVLDDAAIAKLAGGTDDGHRALVARVASPSARTAADADNAALALLRTQCDRSWRGEYQVWNTFLEGDYRPGDAIVVRVPSRAAEFNAIIREVELDAADLLDDRCRMTVKFATEAADPIALRLEPAPELHIPEQASTIASVGTGYIDSANEAEIIDAGSTNVLIDAGGEPPTNGGFEVRRGDSGWGPEDDRNLVGRFDCRIFNVPRTSRSQTWFIRQYDATGRYSRVSTILHLDYPL